MKCKDMKQLDELCFWICKTGLATGSRVIGGYTPKSDFDYVMTVKQAKDLYTSLNIEFNLKSLEQYACLFSSFKYTESSGTVVNLIVVDREVDYEAWRFATFKSKNNYKVGYGSEQRKQLFGEYLADYYEMSLEQLSKNKLEMIQATWRHKRTQNVESYFQYKRSYGE